MQGQLVIWQTESVSKGRHVSSLTEKFKGIKMKQLLCALTAFALMICANVSVANIKHITTPGTITFAKLKTTVSSDVAAHSLITAVITSGDLKGAELSGELSEVHEKSKIYILQYRVVFKTMRVAG
jgi:hypothetical protein